MMDKHAIRGASDALARFKLATGMPPGILDRLKTFGGGQLSAGKGLYRNLRGGFGGAMNPSVITGAVPPANLGIAQGTMRNEALGNLRTLAPSLAAGGGAYMLHRHHQNQEAQQRAMMMQQGYGQGGY